MPPKPRTIPVVPCALVSCQLPFLPSKSQYDRFRRGAPIYHSLACCGQANSLGRQRNVELCCPVCLKQFPVKQGYASRKQQEGKTLCCSTRCGARLRQQRAREARLATTPVPCTMTAAHGTKGHKRTTRFTCCHTIFVYTDALKHVRTAHHYSWMDAKTLLSTLREALQAVRSDGTPVKSTSWMQEIIQQVRYEFSPPLTMEHTHDSAPAPTL